MFGQKIKLDEDLLKRSRLHAKDAGYSSVEEFINHALESALNKADQTQAENVKDDEKKVLDRLKGLGYIE